MFGRWTEQTERVLVTSSISDVLQLFTTWSTTSNVWQAVQQHTNILLSVGVFQLAIIAMLTADSIEAQCCCNCNNFVTSPAACSLQLQIIFHRWWGAKYAGANLILLLLTFLTTPEEDNVVLQHRCCCSSTVICHHQSSWWLAACAEVSVRDGGGK